MAFKWKLKDFFCYVLRLKSEFFCRFIVKIIRRKKKEENDEGKAEDAVPAAAHLLQYLSIFLKNKILNEKFLNGEF